MFSWCKIFQHKKPKVWIGKDIKRMTILCFHWICDRNWPSCKWKILININDTHPWNKSSHNIQKCTFSISWVSLSSRTDFKSLNTEEKLQSSFTLRKISTCILISPLYTNSSCLLKKKIHYPLTLSLLSFLDYSIQPFLFVLRSLGHTDKPLVFGCVVYLPAICHCVTVAVVICCKNPKHSAHSE